MPNNTDFAIIVGINDYQELKNLNGPVDDAIAFRDWLLSPMGGDMPPDNCKFISAGRNPYIPTQDLIDNALNEIIGPDGGDYRRLYFFFAGHGIGIDWNTNGLCLPSWTNRFRNKSISSKGYLDYTVGSSFFQEIYFFLDCCRDRLINAYAMPPTLGYAKPRGQGVASLVLYASDFDNAAGESIDEDTQSTIRGYFSRALIAGLNGAAADANGTITATGLVNFTQRKTLELAQADNESQTVTPQFYAPGRTMDELIIKEGIPVKLTDVTIVFLTAGQVKLSSPTLEDIFVRDVLAGEIAGPYSLGKGLYELVNTATNQELIIKIDSTTDAISYEF
jgi:Caspase domain